MRLIKALNTFFIADADEDIPLSDALWFYGINVGILSLAAIYLFI